MNRKRFWIILIAAVCSISMMACKKGYDKLDGGTYSVEMPGTPERSFIELPLPLWDTTVSMESYESLIDDQESFFVGKVDWQATLEKVKEDRGAAWDEAEFKEGFASVLFSTLVNTGSATGDVNDKVEISGYPAYEYTIGALDDPLTGEKMMDGDDKGTFIAVPTDRSMYVLVYYATSDAYDEENMNAMFDSFTIDE